MGSDPPLTKHSTVTDLFRKANMHPSGLQYFAVSTPENSGSDGGLYTEIQMEHYKSKLQTLLIYILVIESNNATNFK
jgi:hypothetical protein